ncbi:hypothetical protein FHG87_015575 [Trinorchestia longiramus]|nr:hypothetical protein FHG87_015575 [Trinorchestia longiramus]
MDNNENENKNGGLDGNCNEINSALQLCDPDSNTSNANHSVAESDTMQESSGGHTQEEELFNGYQNLFRAEAHGFTSAKGNSKSSRIVNAELHEGLCESSNTNEEPASEENQLGVEDDVSFPVRTQDNSDINVTEEVDAFNFRTPTDARLHSHTYSSTNPTPLSGSELRRCSIGRNQVMTSNDLPLMNSPSVKSFNGSLEGRRLSGNDSTWNSHRHVAPDSISMETNVGDDIPEDLDTDDDVDEELAVLQELDGLVDLSGDSTEENRKQSSSKNVVQRSKQESADDQTNISLETPSAVQNSEENLSVNSSSSSRNGTILLCNSTLHTNSVLRKLVLVNPSGIKYPAVEHTGYPDEVNDVSVENTDNIEENSDSIELINARENEESSTQSLLEQLNQEPHFTTRIGESIISSNPSVEYAEANYLINDDMRERNEVTTITSPGSSSDTSTVELMSQKSPQRRLSTNSQNASARRISVQSVEIDAEESSLDTQLDTQVSEDNGQENLCGGRAELFTHTDPDARRPPSSSRSGRLHMQSSRTTSLDPIMEPVSRVPSPSTALPTGALTSGPRDGENLLLGALNTGQLYSPSLPPLRAASAVLNQTDTSNSADGLATSLDELSMLRVHGTIGESSNRRPMSIIYGHRPLSTRRNSAHRPGSTLNSRPRSTNVCRAMSGRHSWPLVKHPISDVFHLPPSGPDCHPGCGYSGLPCYVCSSKRVEEENKLGQSSSVRHFGIEFPIWTIFRYGNHRGSRVDPYPVPVLHQPQRGRNRNRNGGPPPSYTSLFPETTCFGLRNCCDKCRHSRLTTMILVVLLVMSVIYVLIVAGHFERRM